MGTSWPTRLPSTGAGSRASRGGSPPAELEVLPERARDKTVFLFGAAENEADGWDLVDTELGEPNAEIRRVRDGLTALARRVAPLSEENAQLRTAIGTGSVVALPPRPLPGR